MHRVLSPVDYIFFKTQLNLEMHSLAQLPDEHLVLAGISQSEVNPSMT